MTTDVETALELIAATVLGMALLIALLVVAERALLRPPATRAESGPAPVSAPTAATLGLAPEVPPAATPAVVVSGSVTP